MNPSVLFTITREGDKLLLQQGANLEKRDLLVVQLEGRETGRAKKIK